MLVELAVGDAYGAGFEFRNPLYVRAFNRLDKHRRPALTLGRGRYTDDTQMTIAVAEALLTDEPWTPELLSHHFVEAFKRDQRTGYAPRFHRFLRSVADGPDFQARIRPKSDRSGAAMRSSPLGLLEDLDEVRDRAAVQARVTHDTEAGISSAQAAAVMVHFFAREAGVPSALPAYVADAVPGPWQDPWKGRVSMRGVDCVRAAITAVSETESLSDLLRRCVHYSGDVDTVATIALAAASWSHHHDRDLPAVLIDGLERGPFGYDYLRALDEQLVRHVGPT